MSGIGNIYADEALWRAKVHGERVCASAHEADPASRVLDHARDVMSEALGQGGTSFDALYVNVNGASGYFDRSLHAYGREGTPVRPLRRPHAPRALHEPLVVLLPGLPAAAEAPVSGLTACASVRDVSRRRRAARRERAR